MRKKGRKGEGGKDGSKRRKDGREGERDGEKKSMVKLDDANILKELSLYLKVTAFIQNTHLSLSSNWPYKLSQSHLLSITLSKGLCSDTKRNFPKVP